MVETDLLSDKELEKALKFKGSVKYNEYTQYLDVLTHVNIRLGDVENDRPKLRLALKENERKRKKYLELLRYLTK